MFTVCARSRMAPVPPVPFVISPKSWAPIWAAGAICVSPVSSSKKATRKECVDQMHRFKVKIQVDM